MKTSRISWTDATWNPVVGCDKVSPGCDNCYAEALTRRFPARYPDGFKLTPKPHRLKDPYKWSPRTIFVNSMSDLFHADISLEYLHEVWNVMLNTPQHTYQILTKRPSIMRYRIEYQQLALPPHIWLGTSVESQEFAAKRIPSLLAIPASVRFISAEPLLGPLDLSPWMTDLQWVIVGGESGGGYRPMDMQWARDIRDQCEHENVPLWFKQHSALRPGIGAHIDGKEYFHRPEGLV